MRMLLAAAVLCVLASALAAQGGELVTGRVAPDRLHKVVTDDPAERAWLDELLWDSWERALTDGVVAVPGAPRREVDVLRDAYDAVVVELRSPIRAQAPPEADPRDDGPPSPPRFTAAQVPIVEAHHAVAERARALAGGRVLTLAGSLGQVADDGSARADLAQSMVEIATGVDADFWLSSPIDGWHYEYGTAVAPGVIGRDGALKDAARLLR